MSNADIDQLRQALMENLNTFDKFAIKEKEQEDRIKELQSQGGGGLDINSVQKLVKDQLNCLQGNSSFGRRRRNNYGNVYHNAYGRRLGYQ